MLAATLFTAGQRFAKVWKQATDDVPVAARRAPVSARVRNRQQDRRVARSTTRQMRRRSQLRPPR
jgi:hypothetical protein